MCGRGHFHRIAAHSLSGRDPGRSGIGYGRLQIPQDLRAGQGAGQYVVYVSIGQRDGTPKIVLPLADDDGQHRYRLGEIRLNP
jgi:hypothetical protein